MPNGPSTQASSAFPRYLPELRSRRGHSCPSRARTFGRRRWIAPAAEVSPPSLRGGPVASNKGAQGTRKWGPATLAGRVAGARRCLGPRAVSGGRWRSGERQRGEGGPRGVDRPRAEVAGALPLSQISVRGATRPSGWLGRFVARIRERCRGLECTSARGRPVPLARAFRGPSSAPRP